MVDNQTQIVNAACVLLTNHLLVNIVDAIAGEEISSQVDGVSIKDAMIYNLVSYKVGDLIKLKLGGSL